MLIGVRPLELLVLILLATLLTVHGSGLTKRSTSELVSPLIHFTSRLFGAIFRVENVVVSPISMHLALSILIHGANKNSPTQKELINTLGYGRIGIDEISNYHDAYSKLLSNFKGMNTDDGDDDDDNSNDSGDDHDNYNPPYARRDGQCGDEEDSTRSVRHSCQSPTIHALSMVIAKSSSRLNPSFTKILKGTYKSSAVHLDENDDDAKDKITRQLNNWAVRAKFEGGVLDSGDLDGNFGAMLVSGLSLEASWFSQFDETSHKMVFYNNGRKSEAVRITGLEKTDMGGVRHAIVNEAGVAVRVTDLPLRGGVRFTILEPKKSGGTDDLDRLVNVLMQSEFHGIASKRLERVLEAIDSKPKKTYAVYMPKFKVENTIDLNSMSLNRAGLSHAFDDNNKDFGKILKNGKVKVSEVRHLARIVVDENGIQSAGATKPVLLSKAWHEKIEIVNPFVFMVRFNGLPLLIGQLVRLDAD